MTDTQIRVYLEQIAGALLVEISTQDRGDRQCRLQDAYEYCRRAWHAMEDIPTEDNDTTIETQRRLNKEIQG